MGEALRNPDALLTLAARAAAPHLAQRDLPVLPTDLWEVLQRYMCKKSQIELFSDYKGHFDNGQLRWHTQYKDGRKHGEDKEYYTDGQLQWNILYKDGKVHGECKEYYMNDQLKWNRPYKDDKQHGETKEYYGNGQLKWHLHYKDGKMHGECKEYYSGDQLLWHKFYEDNVCIKTYLDDPYAEDSGHRWRSPTHFSHKPPPHSGRTSHSGMSLCYPRSCGRSCSDTWARRDR